MNFLITEFAASGLYALYLGDDMHIGEERELLKLKFADIPCSM